MLNQRKDGRVHHTSIDLSPYVYRWLRRRRGETGQAIRAIVEQAVGEFIEREEYKATGETSLPPVVVLTGGAAE